MQQSYSVQMWGYLATQGFCYLFNYVSMVQKRSWSKMLLQETAHSISIL